LVSRIFSTREVQRRSFTGRGQRQGRHFKYDAGRDQFAAISLSVLKQKMGGSKVRIRQIRPNVPVKGGCKPHK
jgi:hypothetical protein